MHDMNAAFPRAGSPRRFSSNVSPAGIRVDGFTCTGRRSIGYVYPAVPGAAATGVTVGGAPGCAPGCPPGCVAGGGAPAPCVGALWLRDAASDPTGGVPTAACCALGCAPACV